MDAIPLCRYTILYSALLACMLLELAPFRSFFASESMLSHFNTYSLYSPLQVLNLHLHSRETIMQCYHCRFFAPPTSFIAVLYSESTGVAACDICPHQLPSSSSYDYHRCCWEMGDGQKISYRQHDNHFLLSSLVPCKPIVLTWLYTNEFLQMMIQVWHARSTNLQDYWNPRTLDVLARSPSLFSSKSTGWEVNDR